MNRTQELEAQRARAARNESVFREVNERIEEFRNTASAFVEFVCECALERCAAYVSLTLEEYERIRLDSNRFFVLPGHVLPHVDKVESFAFARLLFRSVVRVRNDSLAPLIFRQPLEKIDDLV